ncbi:MAG: DEAD/DEAH box helicase [Aliiglaciecola sp.]
MIKASTLKNSFPERLWRRGTHLMSQGRILEHSVVFEREKLQGQVFSSNQDEVEDVVVTFSRNGVDSQCTCEIGYQCEHAAAIAALYIKRGRGYEADNQGVTQWLTDLISPSESSNEERGSHFELAYLFGLVQTKNSKQLNVEIVRVKRLKSGELSRSTLSVKNPDEMLKRSWLSSNERYLLADVINELAVHGAIRSYNLVERLIVAKCAYWQSSHETPLSNSSSHKATFDWNQDASGLYKLMLNLPEGFSSQLVLPTIPLSLYDAQVNKIVPLDIDVDADVQYKLLDMPSLNAEQRSWVMPQISALFRNRTTQARSKGKSSEWVDAIIQPRCLLTLCPPDELTSQPYVTLNFKYHDAIVEANLPGFYISTESLGNIPRQPEFETSAITTLESLGFTAQLKEASEQTTQHLDNRFMLEKESWAVFIHYHQPRLKKSGWMIKRSKGFPFQVHDLGAIKAKVTDQKNGYFALSMGVQINGKSVPLAPILHTALTQLPADFWRTSTPEHKSTEIQERPIYVPVAENEHVSIPVDTLKQLTQQFIELTLPASGKSAKRINISKFQSHQLLKAFEDTQIAVDGIKQLQTFAKKIETFNRAKIAKIPNSFKGQLRDYQQDGVNWFQFHTKNGLSGMLADDMGLGKTVQSIAHICIEQQKRDLTDNPFLILAPTSVVHNWLAEIKHFAPKINVVLIHGNERQSIANLPFKPEVVITSYPLLVRDINDYISIDFHTIVADEAQYIKNTKTSLYQTITQLTAQHRFCLTGTPMENHLGELWAQFNWLLPGLLGSQSQFNRLFKTPIEGHQDRERQRRLNDRLRPFILRRDKECIADELGDKTTIIRKVRLEGKQAQMYGSIRLSMDKKLTALIQNKGINRSQIDILSAMLKLRQVCCHPDLLNVKQKQDNTSAKLDLLLDMLDELLLDGRKIIVFSQFTSMLEIIERALNQRKITYAKLTGQTRNRQQQIVKFKQSEIPIFLISLKAGGTGLNLTEADTVIHYDPWWNPAAENQATDRAHRIGQNKPVFVYKLVVEGSIEEKILELQSQKSNLAKTLLSDASESDLTRLTQDHIKMLMRPLEAF